jgi:hypothetical protein
LTQAAIRRALTTFGLCLSLLGTSVFSLTAGAQAGTSSASRLHVSADAMTVHVGSAIVLSGTASPAAGLPVYLQRWVGGRWRYLTHQATGTTGGFAFSVKAPGTVTTWVLRVVRAKQGSVTAAVSRTEHIKITKASFHVKATSPKRVAAGKALVVTGSVTPKATGPVKLQILRGTAWTALATATLTRKSTFTLKATRPAGAYRLRVIKPFTATIASGVSATQTVAFDPSPTTTPGTPGVPVTPAAPALRVASPDDAVLALATPRLVFSAVLAQPLPGAKSLTVTNSGTASATVSGLSISGTDASSYALAAAQPRTFAVPAGASVTIPVTFQPTAPTNCPTASNPASFSDANRSAALTFATTDPSLPSVTANLGGVISCALGGNGEPVLGQILSALGYTDVVNAPGTDPRFLGTQIQPNTDEVASPYFTAANPASPVTVTALAHYSSPSTTPYHATGWYTKGAALPTDGSCNANCLQLWQFPADPSLTTYNQNQKLMPTTTGTTAFSPYGTFGLYTGDKKDVVFSDDALNPASTSATTGPHDERVYPAYGANHVLIPNTYLVAIDTGRASESKNHDFQDVVLIVRNVTPAK